MKDYKMPLNTVNILGIPITGGSLDEVLRELSIFVAELGSSEKTSGRPSLGLTVFTPNPEFLVKAEEDLSFQKLLKEADMNLPDGIGLVWASRVLGRPIKERVSGADVVEKLLETGNKESEWTIGITGARRGVAEESAELTKRLREKFSGINFINLDDPGLKLKIKNYKFQIVFACHGMGEQERWIMENRDKINSKIFMGIGGSLDFITGFTKRAPIWMRKIGLEWLWRGLQRPKHFKRIWKAVFVFGSLIIKEKLNVFFRLDSQ